MKDLLDTPRAAAYVGLSRQTMAKMRCLGGSPAFFKLGSRVFYDRADLDAWLEARRRPIDPGSQARSVKYRVRRAPTGGAIAVPSA